MSQPISDELLHLELEELEVYDSYLQQNVLVVPPLLMMADNPRTSEILNHIGSSAIFFLQNMSGTDTHLV